MTWSLLLNRFGEDNQAAPNLRKMSKHEVEENWDVCLQEETKSPTLKISGTKILERVFIPSNECWICDLKFDDSESQINHFTEHHECDFCDRYFARLQEKRKHVLDEHECPLCGKYFKYDFKKEWHIEEEHSNSDF